MTRRLPLIVAALLAVLLTVTGCSSVEGSGSKGYVSGDGTIQTLDAADRGAPVELSGKTLDGTALDLADLRGRPTVVVVWGSWCVECREEAGTVAAAADELRSTARFVGIALRDNTAAADAYVQRFDVTYPSIFAPGGQEMLAFDSALNPNTIPAFVVLDAQGRVAAVIRGQLPSQQTLVDLVRDVAGETGSGGSGGTGSPSGGARG
ncbi:TlpA family protein disulfide reductase [Nocardioides sp. TRM66260-LWL]|uniref:TlpA family protein disulfide reductase n=1 Tax=Nocardioides sp. TRM66260-LWL TaxID=2874478 RepID=UPI001CC3A890|nr:TlpA disulfide reductase family protein [Nocardioides sp. TRM66260-LWL]MBZ5734801.1 TlpA family protein disulfide reductase [Nocardioides sp. TRM66260-LWL]